MSRPALGVVLSAGGLRGAAHLGVLRRLIGAGVPIDVLVGTSAGAVVGAYYAAVGLSIEEIIADAPRLRPRHLLMHALALRVPRAMKPWLRPFCGIVPARLEALERARFDHLHHGVRGFGVVCHDVDARKPWYFSTAESHGATLAGVVKASAAVPPVFPSRLERIGGRDVQLTDGGFSDGVPFDFPRHAGLDATHVLVSDCRRSGSPVLEHDRLMCVRPALSGTGTGKPGRFGLVDAVKAGEDAVTDDALERLHAWLAAPTRPANP